VCRADKRYGRQGGHQCLATGAFLHAFTFQSMLEKSFAREAGRSRSAVQGSPLAGNVKAARFRLIVTRSNLIAWGEPPDQQKRFERHIN